jgi:hypothetical protein
MTMTDFKTPPFAVQYSLLCAQRADGTTIVLQVDADGNLPMALELNSITSSENLAKVGGTTVSTGAGPSDAGCQRVTLANESNPPTAAAIAAAVLKGSHVLRVHDVGMMKKVAAVAQAILKA